MQQLATEDSPVFRPSKWCVYSTCTASAKCVTYLQ